MASKISEVSATRVFAGVQKIFSHDSKELGCKMNFAIYLPDSSEKLPVLYWLSGLTCNETNFIQKSGAQRFVGNWDKNRFASEHKVIIVCPDTSPRGCKIPGDSDSWDFGVGAGFYVDATQKPWAENYRMFSYVTSELIALVHEHFAVIPGNQSIFGHSMGGHGALICALKKPGLYKSVSAFAPISNPSQCPWGIKAFSGYLGTKETGNWQHWDATELVQNYNGAPLELFIDQGTSDQFYKDKQLLPENLIEACKNVGMPAVLKMREGFDHSYYYIATFVEEHVKFHAQKLKLKD